MSSYILFFVCLFGVCLGSFYNVVILRSLSDESIVYPPSKCPKCNHRLYFWHNIPIISYILLKGKCYFCNEKISIQYPIIEALTMILFGCCYLKFELSIKFFFAIILISALLIMTVTDIKEKVVDCNIAIGLAIVGVVYNFIISPSQGLYSIIGGVVAILIFEIIARIGIKPFGVRIIAEGDTYVAAAIGACFGVYNICTILIYTLIGAMVYALPVYFIKQYKLKNIEICALIGVFLTSTICYYFCQNLILLVLLAASGLFLAFKIIKNISTDEDNLIMPFVPALTFGTAFYLFFA